MKQLKSVLISGLFILLFLFFSADVQAASLSVRISEPKTPTSQRDFNLDFVALDIEGRAVTVSCFKKGPTDGGFSQFGSNISLPAGGDSNSCSVNSSIVNSDGTYSFYVKAVAGADTENSSQVNVEFSSDSPWTPVSYSKDKINSCEYKIKFKTADDGGRTVKVEIYRSTETSFNLDSSTRVASISVGSNEEKEYVDTVPDCGKDYYYAIRAFDNKGNGSGSIGDSIVKTTTISSTATEGQVQGGQGQVGAGAIEVAQGEGFVSDSGEEAGQKQEEEGTVEGEQGEVKSDEDILGAETQDKTQTYIIIGIIGLVILGIMVYVVYKRKQK